MSDMTVHTGGGSYIGRDTNIEHGDFVSQDKVLGNKYQTIVVTSVNPSLGYYIERVQNARKMLTEGVLPSDLDTVKHPLSYYQRIRPQRPYLHSPDEEIEVQGILINNLASSVQVLDIQIPGGVEFIGNPLFVLGQVSPFGVLAAVRYVTRVKCLEFVRLLPCITYQASGESTVRYDISSSFLPLDEASLVMSLIDRESVINEFKSHIETIEVGQPGPWLAVADTWGTGRSRVLAECVHIVREQGILPFEVLEKIAYPASTVDDRGDPIREALLSKFGEMGSEEAILRFVYWLEGSLSQRQNVRSMALFVQYMCEGAESDNHLRAVAEGLLNRAREHPLLLILDDLHNARLSTLRLLQMCREQLHRNSPSMFMVCASYDPERCIPALRDCFAGQEMSLEDLNAGNVIAFAKNWFPQLRCAPDSWGALISFLGWRPLLIRQGLEYLQNNGYIVLKQGHWLLKSDFYKDPGVKFRRSFSESSGLGMLMAEYRRLWTSPQPKEQLLAKALRVAAAIGAEFEYTLWEQAMYDFLGCTEIESRDLCTELTNRDFVVSLLDKDKPGMYRITPPALQHRLFADIQGDWNWTSKLHVLIAQSLSQEIAEQPFIEARRAHHLLWSKVPANMSEAFKIFHELAFNRLNHQSLDETIILLHRALEAAQDSQGRVPEYMFYRVRYELGQVLDERGAWDEAYEEARQVALVCENKGLTLFEKNEQSTTNSPVSPEDELVTLFELATQAHVLAGWVSQELGAIERAFDHYQRAERILSNEVCQELSEARAYLLRKQAAWYAEQRQLGLAANYYERLLNPPITQLVPDLGQAYASYAEVLRRLGQMEAAQIKMSLAFTNVEALSDGADKDLLTSRINIQAGVLVRKTNPQQSQIYLEQALQLAQCLGALKEWALAEEWLGIVNSDMDADRPSGVTLEHYAHAAELYETLGDMQKLHIVVHDYVSLLLLAGEYDAVCQIVERAIWLGISNKEMEEMLGFARRELKGQLHRN